MILAWPIVNPKPTFGGLFSKPLAISTNPFLCCSFFSTKFSSTLLKCHCTHNKNTDKSTQYGDEQGFSVLTSDIPWKTGSLWSTMAVYMFNLHFPLGFYGLSIVAYILHQPVLDPQTQALSLLVLDILELLATLLLLKSTIKPKNRLMYIFKFNELSIERNWLLASAVGFGMLILLVFLTSIVVDGLYGVKALKSNKLFILNHHDALMPHLRRINSTSTKTYATRTLFFLQDDDTLKPLAIELSLPHPQGDSHGAVSKVFTSAEEDGIEGSVWQLAKAYAAVNDSGYHQLICHWLNTHAVIEPFIIASNRQLSVVHPIYKLLHPHYRDTMNINAMTRQTLINAGGVLELTVFPESSWYTSKITKIIL